MRLLLTMLIASMLTAAPALKYASYFGGKADDSIARVVLDSAGNIYIAGTTSSTDLPVTAGVLQSRLAGGRDIFVARFNPAGKLVYCTYLGGGQQDDAYDLTVDSGGYAYVTGTSTGDFPVSPGSYRTASSGGSFVAKLNPAGTALAYSTYLDSVRAEAYGIAVDKAGNTFVVGTTYSPEFPTTLGAIRRTPESNDVFIAKLNSSGTNLVYSTLLGGSSGDTALRVAVDDAGNAFVAGVTTSTDFPVTAGAFQKQKGSGRENGFVLKLNPGGTALVYATYLGGGTADGARAIAIDSAGNAYLTGITYSHDFPTTLGAYLRSFSNSSDAFVAKLNTDGTSLVYSTFLGALDGNDIALRSNSEVYVTGTAAKGFFTTPDALHAAPEKFTDAFLVRLNTNGTGISYSTCLGGNDNDGGSSVAFDPAGVVYVAGATVSNDFPVTADGLQRISSGGINGDAFLAAISEGRPITNFVTVSAASFAADATAPGAIASGFGESLAARIERASGPALPETLGGITVRVRDSTGKEHVAPLFFVSPSQINYLVPEATQAGLATVTVFDAGTAVAAGWAQIERVAPALFSQNGDGKGVAAAVAIRISAGGEQTVAPVSSCTAAGTCVAIPLDLGDANQQVILLLYGTGIRGRTALEEVRVQIGGAEAEVQYAGAQGEYPGLDQVNVKLPPALAARGEVAIVLTADGKPANQVTISVR